MSKAEAGVRGGSAVGRRIIYVPGKNIKPEPATHREQLWRCLISGVERLQPEVADEMDQDPDRFSLASWNHEFYGRHGSLEKDVPWIDKLIESNGPTDEERREALSWHKWATKLMYAAGDRFHGLIKWIPDQRVKAMIADTNPYFQNETGIADRIRETVKRLILEADRNGERVLLIGHSMGSVIAYEALWQLTHEENHPCGVELFLTMGSPMGMHYVQKHLLGKRSAPPSYPHGISRWENVSAIGDLISVDEYVHDDFAGMLNSHVVRTIHDHADGVFNWFRNDDGLNVHRSYGYLVNPVVGKLIAEWWRVDEGGQAPTMVAHRGYPSAYPENTLLGYEQALAAGAEFVELDVQLSKDRVPLMYHDPDTQRVSGVDGSLFDLPLERLKQLDARVPERFGNRFSATPLSTVTEFAALMEKWPEVQAFVEIKSESVERFGVEDTIDRVASAIDPIKHRCVLISFHDKCIEYARDKHGFRIGWVLPAWDTHTRCRAYAFSPEFLFVWVGRLPEPLPQELWQGPWDWAVYVVNEAKQANQYPLDGILYVETDEIGELLADPELNR